MLTNFQVWLDEETLADLNGNNKPKVCQSIVCLKSLLRIFILNIVPSLYYIKPITSYFLIKLRITLLHNTF